MKTNNLVFIKDRSSPTIVYDCTKEYPLLLVRDEEYNTVDFFGEEFRVGKCKVIDHTVTELPTIQSHCRYRHTFVIKITEFKLDEFKGFIYKVTVNNYNNILNFILEKEECNE